MTGPEAPIVRSDDEAAIAWCEEHDSEIPAKWNDCRLAVHQAAAGYYGRIADCAPRVLGSDAAQAVGRFRSDGPPGYRARSGGPLRTTRVEAEIDERKHFTTADGRQNLDSDLPNPSLGGRGNPGGDPVRSGAVAGSKPASATPPSGPRRMCNDGACPEWEIPHLEHRDRTEGSNV